MNLTDSFLSYFFPIEDPREDNHNRRHNFHDILIITILATICGANTWTEICEFGEAKIDWFKTFLELPNGIPSHDTFGCVFSLMDSEKFEACFNSWIESLEIDVKNEIISILSLPQLAERRLWFFIDELPSLHRLPSLVNTLSRCRKYGGCFVVGAIQDIHQLHSVYGRDEAETLTALFNTNLCYRTNGPDSAVWMSKVMGSR